LATDTAHSCHLYEQVATALRGAITRGELKPGKAIPSEAELKAQHGVSRDAARKALGVLTQKGLITAGQVRTRYVRAYAPLRWTLSSFRAKTGWPPVRRSPRSPATGYGKDDTPLRVMVTVAPGGS